MAVPTFSSITPDTGKTTGRARAVIEGTNFRLPPEPPSGPLGGTEQFTVSVKVSGVECPWAAAASETEIHAVLPEYGGTASALPLAADVRISNLDDNGNEIAGEQVTAVAAFTYQRTKLSTETHFERVVTDLVEKIERHVTPQVDISASADYDDDITDVKRYEGRLPVIELTGPTVRRSEAVRQCVIGEYEDDPSDSDQHLRRIRGIVVDVEFGVRILAKYAQEIYVLTTEWNKLWRDIPWLEVDGEKLEVEIPWGEEASITTAPQWSDLTSARSRVVVRGVHIDGSNDTIVERGWRITDNGGEIEIEVVRHEP